MGYHSALTDASLHVPGYAQATDPGAIGAYKCWIDTSGGAGAWVLKVRNAANSGWETFSRTLSKSFTIPNPTADDDFPIWRTPTAITITAIHVLCLGGTNVVGGLDECDGDGANAAAICSDITATAGTMAAGTVTNGSVDAGDVIAWHTTSVSGTPTSVTVTFEYELGSGV